MNYLLALIFFVCSAQLAADDMRPASLSITEQDSSRLQLVLTLPIKNGVRQNLTVMLSNDAQSLGPKKSRTLNNTFHEYWAVSREQGLAGLDIHIDGLQQGQSGDVLLRLINQHQSAKTVLLNADNSSYTVPNLKVNTPIDTAITYTVLGIEHILIGLDHLLFVACLVYIAGSGKKLLLTITGFTIAHSVTLILAATDTLTIPIAPVEAVIALSIVFLAGEIARNHKQSLSFRRPVLVSSSFGLLHGFGFASVLAQIGLPPTEKILALLCFNVGVEIGQLLFVAVLLALGFVLGKLLKGDLARTKMAVVYTIGGLAMYWMLQRIAQF